MKTTAEIRLQNLRLLVKRLGTQDALAEAGEVSAVYLSQLLNEAVDIKTGRVRQMGDRVARRLEEKLKLGRGWMDMDHGTSAGASQAPFAREGGVTPVVAMEGQKPWPSPWPFTKFSLREWHALPQNTRGDIEDNIEAMVIKYVRSAPETALS